MKRGGRKAYTSTAKTRNFREIEVTYVVQGGTGQKQKFDLDERTFRFAKDVATLCKSLPRNITNAEYVKQVVRSSGSVGANYLEANEAISKKDRVFRFRICRKEIRETIYWLRLLESTNTDEYRNRLQSLTGEADQLIRIFATIIAKLAN
ncbi:MAG TPA: four helix bundle protein [Bacteroidota bacterium]|nr:four helix bundle protein [Bacteroidota bacterium]